MICDVCKKNPAKLHITQMVNDKKFTLHICPSCATEKGVTGPSINTSFSVEQLLSGGGEAQPSEKEEEMAAHQTCPSCGLSYGSFKESGRLGCSLCYETFSAQIKPLLQKIQKEVKHKGKVPDKGDAQLVLKRNITDLRMQLKEAVSQEHFEEAAQLRDQIRKMENELGEMKE